MQLPVRRRQGVPQQRGQAAWWDPFEELEAMWHRMGSLFERAAEDRKGWVPVVEVDEDKDAYTVKAELPGVGKDDVQVDIDEGGLRITGQTERADDRDQAKTLRRRSGQFSYYTSIPSDVDTKKAEAVMRDGVLTVRLPRTESRGRRRLQLK